MDAKSREHPATDEGADDPDDEIADQSKPRALHDLAGQPPSDNSDQQYDQQTFT
jgi:hypothetical protein